MILGVPPQPIEATALGWEEFSEESVEVRIVPGDRVPKRLAGMVPMPAGDLADRVQHLCLLGLPDFFEVGVLAFELLDLVLDRLHALLRAQERVAAHELHLAFLLRDGGELCHVEALGDKEGIRRFGARFCSRGKLRRDPNATESL